nr:hypothetical protein [Tanacetum cinerariifolium]
SDEDRGKRGSHGSSRAYQGEENREVAGVPISEAQAAIGLIAPSEVDRLWQS